ncbi:MAG: tRNA pseudouridine(55) synthase TruB [Syntrophothermaceae bacterium]
MHGFLNVNKPAGMSSFAVVKRVRKYFKKRRVGHLGTLDPMAEGVLPIAVGAATRIIEFIMDVPKGYRAEMTLGAVSDTQDAWGVLTYISEKRDCELPELKQVLESFRGEIQQVPPMYSALNYQGQRLYQLARQGVSVDVKPRSVTIYSLELVEAPPGNRLDRVVLDVVCSKGTYIRTLCHDIGQILGCGAYLSGLVRYSSGSFRLEEAIELEKLEQQLAHGEYSTLLPLDYPINHLSRVVLQDKEDVRKILNGNTIDIETGSYAGPVRIYSPEGQLLALGRILTDSSGQIRVKPDKVFNYNKG